MGMGYNEKLIWTESMESGDDFSSKQYYGCKMESDGVIALTTSDDDVPVGLILNNPEDGQVAELLIVGRAPGVVSEAIDEGELVKIASGGMIALFEPLTDTTKYCIGQCVKAAENSGEMGVFLFNFATPVKGDATS